MIITVNYVAKYRLKFAENYVFTTCGLCYNCKTKNLIKQILKGSTIGYVILGKFHSLTYLRTKLELIPKPKKSDYPF
jgi:hypothetical protein